VWSWARCGGIEKGDRVSEDMEGVLDGTLLIWSTFDRIWVG
jgi:hypothetical protein